jgi:hypothetical protein
MILSLTLQPGWWKHRDVQAWWHKAGERWPMGQDPWGNNRKASWGGLRLQGLNNPGLEQAFGHYSREVQMLLGPR